MRIFSRLYDRVLGWSRHAHAPWYLGGLSFAESSFFPVPPDVMLAPMSLAQPQKAWQFALLTTVTSILGGVLGYLIGVYAFGLVEPWLHQAGYWPAYIQVSEWFSTWGFWAVFMAGFSPIPYKLFTISAGVIGMSFIPFLLASAVGRGGRFFLVAGLMRWGGEKMERTLRLYIDRISWALVILLLVLYFIINSGGHG